MSLIPGCFYIMAAGVATLLGLCLLETSKKDEQKERTNLHHMATILAILLGTFILSGTSIRIIVLLKSIMEKLN